jgi:hypothetical protein
MPGKIFLAFIALVMLWGGGQGVYVSVTNTSPSRYSVKEYIDNKPSAKWLQLSGARLDLTAVTYSSTFGVGDAKEVYIPVVPIGQEESQEIHLLLATKDPKILETVDKLRALKSEDEVMQFIFKNASSLLIERDVEGLIRFGLEFKEDDKHALKRENPNLSEDFVVIDEGTKPDYFATAFVFICGICLSAWLIYDFRKPAKPASQSSPPPLPQRDAAPRTAAPPPLPPSRS